MSERKLRLALIIDYITSDYSKTILSGIKAACSQFGMEILIFPIGVIGNLNSPYDYQMVSITSLLTNKHVDGIIIESSSQMLCLKKEELTSYIKSFRPLPIVNITTELPGIPSITVDCYGAYKALIENLIKEQECKRFCVISGKGNSADIKNRLKTVKTVLKENNVPSENITILKSILEFDNTVATLNKYYQKAGSFDFDAILAFNDEMALASLEFCRTIKKKVPGDIAITGFDDIDRVSYSNPPITSVNQQIFEQGFKAVEMMKQKIEGKKIPLTIKIDAKTSLRKSCFRKSENCEQNNFIEIDNGNLDYIKLDSMHNEWFTKRNQFYQVTKFYTDMQYDMTMEVLQKKINKYLNEFALSSFSIILYEQPIEKSIPFEYFNLPHKAFVFSCFDYAMKTNINAAEKRIEFDPNECIIPAGLVESVSKEMYVIAMYHNEVQYGYMLVGRGDYDISIYDLVSRITSTIISSVYSYELMGNNNAKIQDQYDRLSIVANSDELTGLYNRRGLLDFGNTTLRLSEGRRQTGIVVFCDIDGLKKINDTYGHESGDKAIVAESIILKGNFRSSDIIARIGGDEFAIISPGLTKETFEKIKRNTESDCDVWTETSKSPFKLSISMGYTEYPSKDNGYDLTGLMAEADKRLYEEKRIKKS